MKRLSLLFVAILASPLFAGKFEKDVKDLGDANLRPAAMDRLAEAELEAFDDLMDGLKADPYAEGVDDVERAKRATTRLASAQLLGSLRDTRAAAEMLRLLKDEKTRQEAHQFVATLSQSLALIWSGKSASAERTAAIEEIKLRAGAEDSGNILRLGALRALATLKEGAEIALPCLAEDKDEMLRNEAIAVLAATGHRAATAQLLEIWTKQSSGESKNFTRTLGINALFAVASFKDKAAVDGLIFVLTKYEFDREGAIRARARSYLKEFKADAVPRLATIIKDDQDTIRHAPAAELMAQLGGEGVKALLDLSKLDEPSTTKYADRVGGLLRSLRGDEAVDSMIEAFRLLEKKDAQRVKLLDQLLLSRPKKAVKLFKEAVDDKDLEAQARARALEAYADTEGKESLEELKRWSSDEELVVRRAAVRCIGKSYIPLTKSEELLKAKANDVDPETRGAALKGLSLHKKKELLEVFTKAITPEAEPDPAVRKTAIEALDAFNRNASLNDQGLLEPLKKSFAEDKVNDVRAAALRQLVNVAMRRNELDVIKTHLELGFGDAEPIVRSQAYTMVYLHPSEVDIKKLIAAALKETETIQKGDAVQALSNMDLGDDTELAGLTDLALSVLQQPSITNAGYARNLIRKLTEKGVPPIAPRIRELLKAADAANPKDYRRMALYVDTLSDIKDQEAFVLVKELAKQPNFDLRMSCVKFIGANGERSDIPFLRELRDIGDTVAPAARQEIENAINQLEQK